MFPRIALAVLALVALAAASPAPNPNPIEEKLQPIIASKNNMGLVNPPTPNSNAASGRAVSGTSAVLAVGVVAVFM
ncbi:hypothetical protein B0H19DRAFT_1246202 [Mycena capillaripes]|nr:hypothetical protein B0H19DRAFT_1246202 [Mycena capillaripes]